MPNYLKENISRTKSLFKDKKIVLVHDSANDSSVIAKLGVKTFVFDPHLLRQTGFVAPLLNHDSKFWKGYWQNTFNRLFAVGAYQSAHKGERVIHIESDVVLFSNFPFEAFTKLEKLAWPRVSETHDVASIVYSPSETAYQDFLYELRKTAESDPWTTDMLAMSKFSRDFPHKVLTLPSVPLTHGQNNTVQGERLAWELFQGVFDGLTFGHWFSGRDPRNSWGFRHRYLVPVSSQLDYSAYTFSLDANDCLKIDNSYPIFNMHIHSKNLGYFKAQNRDFLIDEIAVVNKRANRIQFFLGAFIVTIKTHIVDLGRAALKPRKWKSLVRRLRKKL